MKKLLILSLSFLLVFAFVTSCKKKVEQTPPPPPQVKEQPKVEKVEEPPAKEPVLSEEEIFARKTLEELNAEKPIDMIHFDFDKFFIREDAKPVLEANAAWLKKWTSVKVLIEGHCDERGTNEYNLALGERRANAAKDFLIALGISPDRLMFISYGEEKPAAYGSTEDAWAQNRRDEFRLLK